MRLAMLCCSLSMSLLAAVLLGGCVSTKTLMHDAVQFQAVNDLVCDTGGVVVRQIGATSKFASQRQGNVERATWAAEGCGGREVYTVECVRGVCAAIKEVQPGKQNRYLEGTGNNPPAP